MTWFYKCVIILMVMLFMFVPSAQADTCANGVATTFEWPLNDWETNCNDYWSTCNGNHHLGSDSAPGDAAVGLPVYAPCTGVVKESQFHNGYGGTVIMECYTGDECVSVLMGHMFPESYNYNGTAYGGLQVSAGQSVSKGTLIGYLADRNTNRNGNYSPHSHIGIHKGSYASTPTTSCDGGWSYAGYTSSSCVEDDWYSPDTFITAHSEDGYTSSTNPASNSDLEDALSAMHGADLHDLNPFASYEQSTMVSDKLKKLSNGSDGDLHIWYSTGTDWEDDGVPDNAWVQDYSAGDSDGAIIVHEDSAYAVPIYSAMWKIWGLNTYTAGSITDNCGKDWFGSGYGPSSEFGLPITGTYYVEDNNRWRQDFQRGYITRNPDTDQVYLNCYTNSTPGWNNGGWVGEISAAFAQAYWRNGGKEIVGWAYDNGGGSMAHIWGSVYIQDFEGEVNGGNAIILNLYHLDDPTMNKASVLRDGIWVYYKTHDGQLYYGAPLGDEMDTSEESTHDTLRGYDPYCDDDGDGWVTLTEREACILEFCKNSRYDSMQRFDYATICYADEWISDDYTIMGSTETETYTVISTVPTQEDIPVFMVYEPGEGDWYWITSSGTSMRGAESAEPVGWAEESNNYYYDTFYTDVNGDGIPDLVVYQNVNGAWYVQLGDGFGGFTDDGAWRTGYGTSSSGTQYQGKLGDVDGDGLPDAIIYEPGYGYWYVAYNTGYSFEDTHYRVLEGWATATFTGRYQVWAADVTGDGVVEFIAWEPAYGYWYVAYNTNPATDGAAYAREPAVWASGWAKSSTAGKYICDLADVDGDGDADVMAFEPGYGYHYVMLSNGSSFQNQGLWLSTWAKASFSGQYVPFYEDVNFDGMSDLVIWEPNYGYWYVAPSTGSSFSPGSTTLWLNPGALESFDGQYEPIPKQ